MRLEEVIAQSYACHCGSWGWDGQNLQVIIRGMIYTVSPYIKYWEIPVLKTVPYLEEEASSAYNLVPFETTKHKVPRYNWKLGPLELFAGLYD